MRTYIAAYYFKQLTVDKTSQLFCENLWKVEKTRTSHDKYRIPIQLRDMVIIRSNRTRNYSI